VASLNALALKARPHLKNAGWSSAEYVFYPLLMLAATPVLVACLGTERYGLFMLVNSLASIGGAATLGVGAATIKFVSSSMGRRDRGGAALTVQATLALAVAGSVVLGLAMVFAAPALSTGIFARMGASSDVSQAIVFAAFMLAAAQVDGVFACALKGMEKFALAARLEIVLKVAMIAAAMIVAWKTRNLGAVLATTCAIACVSAITKGIATSRLLGVNVLTPRIPDRQTLRRVLGFGVWSWLSVIGSLLYVHADRLLIGAMLGATALGYYTVCAQLAQQLHALPAAAMSVLFPLISRKSQNANAEAIARVQTAGIGANVAMALGLGGVFLLYGDDLLRLWMGAEFARGAGDVLFWLVIAYLILALTIAPYYLLLGRNEARYASLTNLLGGIAGLAAALVLIPVAGAVGAAQARIMLGLVSFANYWKLARIKAYPAAPTHAVTEPGR
jgi:O-antigen/teichoic acid export membrane protein